MEMRAACWSIGSAYESLTVDDAKTIKSLPSCVDELHNIIAYSIYKCNCNTRAHTTRTHIGVHLLSLRALWLVQYEFAVSAIWHIFYLATIL